MAETIRIRCRQTGFRARLPVETWEAYAPEQRATYEVLDGDTGTPALPEQEADNGEVGE